MLSFNRVLTLPLCMADEFEPSSPHCLPLTPPFTLKLTRSFLWSVHFWANFAAAISDFKYCCRLWKNSGSFRKCSSFSNRSLRLVSCQILWYLVVLSQITMYNMRVSFHSLLTWISVFFPLCHLQSHLLGSNVEACSKSFLPVSANNGAMVLQYCVNVSP